MKIAGIVILYYPEDNVLQHILTYSHALDKLYVADNSENKNKAITEQITALPNVIYLHDGENKGIAHRLNQAAALAIAHGYQFLLTMDQDSYFENDAAVEYFNCISLYNNIETTAMFGVEFLKQEDENKKCSPLEVTELITSGSVLNLNVYTAVKGFDEALFIDLVDHEYCYRSILFGYKIIQFKNIFLQHSLGTGFKGRSVATLKITNRTFHSPVRIYYMVRNYLYVKKKYASHFKPYIDNHKKTILVRIKNNLIYGKNRIANITYILKAITDYNKSRMGKIKE